MKISTTSLKDLYLIEPISHKDDRGSFLEIFHNETYKKIINEKLIQDNFCSSKKNVLRGMHFTRKSQSQLVTILDGIVFDVFVDLRKDSYSYGKWEGFELNSKKVQQIYMPYGFAHGYCVLSDNASLHYKVSKHYRADEEDGFIWNDNFLEIKWPIKNPIISSRDKQFKSFKDIEIF
jgi:dTDP-4-dehydrorhamnose 3,5-epimerase